MLEQQLIGAFDPISSSEISLKQPNIKNRSFRSFTTQNYLNPSSIQFNHYLQEWSNFDSDSISTRQWMQNPQFVQHTQLKLQVIHGRLQLFMVIRGSNPYSYRPNEVLAKLFENGSEPNTGSVGTDLLYSALRSRFKPPRLGYAAPKAGSPVDHLDGVGHAASRVPLRMIEYAALKAGSLYADQGNSIPTFVSHMCIFKAIEENVFFGGGDFLFSMLGHGSRDKQFTPLTAPLGEVYAQLDPGQIPEARKMKTHAPSHQKLPPPAPAQLPLLLLLLLLIASQTQNSGSATAGYYNGLGLAEIITGHSKRERELATILLL
ncbi:hypothetical protein LguiB_035819 [Lonicera macranthoides]